MYSALYNNGKQLAFIQTQSEMKMDSMKCYESFKYESKGIKVGINIFSGRASRKQIK